MTDFPPDETPVYDLTEVVSAPIPAPLELTDIATPMGIMVDLETLGTGGDAVLLSIGAAKFNSDEIVDSFHVAIDPATAQGYGLKIDADTVMWWLDPGRAEAREALLKLERVDLVSALLGFAMWIGGDSIPLWGNGATFDNAILRNAYAATGIDYPIKFYHDRCYRTIKNMAPEIAMVREGTHHDALDDAISQAKHLLTISKNLDLVL